MGYNGMFADDGRVSELADVIANAIKGMQVAVDGLNDVLTGRIEANESEILAATNRNAEQDNTLAAITNGLSGLTNGVGDLSAAFDAIAARFDNLEMENKPVWGRVTQTNGFTTLTTSGNPIPLTYDRGSGDMEYYPDFGGGMRVPYTGAYIVFYNVFVSGPVTGYATIRPQIYRDGVLHDSLPVAIVSKPNDADVTISRSAIVYLSDLDCLTLRGSSTSPNVSSWGDSGRVGTDMLALWLGYR